MHVLVLRPHRDHTAWLPGALRSLGVSVTDAYSRQNLRFSCSLWPQHDHCLVGRRDLSSFERIFYCGAPFDSVGLSPEDIDFAASEWSAAITSMLAGFGDAVVNSGWATRNSAIRYSDRRWVKWLERQSACQEFAKFDFSYEIETGLSSVTLLHDIYVTRFDFHSASEPLYEFMTPAYKQWIGGIQAGLLKDSLDFICIRLGVSRDGQIGVASASIDLPVSRLDRGCVEMLPDLI